MSALRLASVLVLSTVLAVFGVTAGAVAQSTPSTAPPGNSAVDQYRESAPPSSTKQRKLSRRDREALERRGADGAALAAVLDRTGGVPQAAAPRSGATASSGDGKDRAGRGTRERSGSGAGASATAAGKGATADPADGVTDAQSIAPAAASSTVGPVPVWAMLVAAVALVGVGLLVRRRTIS